ncbi:hypothetical protein BDM02DRAFT_3177017 [Thelephora ganbajun]|uniref:Uncharacterized protein n=1 Tax=Thelephora ganbajun TaxID=370292 RepID=A0ACB6YXD4_THEGA|nr:hypothetical protein BDM02DRAFT_3177017 [Thelephora ganbajun]
MAVCFILLFVDTKGGKPSLWEDRAAHIGASQVPIVVALAGKNNIVSLLTGIGHERLNILHRASSRVCLLLLWLHALTRYFNV